MKLFNGVLSHGIHISIIFLAISCGKLDSNGDSGGSIIPDNPIVVGEIFKVTVGTIYESDSTNTVSPGGSCSINSGDSTPKTCSTSIPEGELYYGKLRINATVTNKSKCAIFTFQPFFYQMSSSIDFKPSTATSAFSALDCSASPINAGCFSGPATAIAPSFPTNTAIYYLPSANPILEWTIDSANTIRQTKNFDPGNKWTTNLLAVKGTTQIDYIRNSMVDWQFTCNDIFSDTLYSIKLNIGDIDGVRNEHVDSDDLVVPIVPIPISNEIFKVTVGTIYETDSTNTVLPQGSCSINDGDSSTPKICSTISIPEGQLYYGKLRINATVTNKSKCAIFTFRPYYYQMSSSIDFKPTNSPNFTALDCSASPINAGCFSGPATVIAPSFPINRAIYYLPSTDPILEWTIDSANSIRQTQNFNPGNKWTTNMLGDRGNSQTDYIGGSMQDWRFTCDDIFSDTQYSIILKIGDVDGVVDSHVNWVP